MKDIECEWHGKQEMTSSPWLSFLCLESEPDNHKYPAMNNNFYKWGVRIRNIRYSGATNNIYYYYNLPIIAYIPI